MALSSLGLLKTSKPPNLHSPDGDKKMESTWTFPCVDAAWSLTKDNATLFCRLSAESAETRTNARIFYEDPTTTTLPCLWWLSMTTRQALRIVVELFRS